MDRLGQLLDHCRLDVRRLGGEGVEHGFAKEALGGMVERVAAAAGGGERSMGAADPVGDCTGANLKRALAEFGVGGAKRPFLHFGA